MPQIAVPLLPRCARTRGCPRARTLDLNCAALCPAGGTLAATTPWVSGWHGQRGQVTLAAAAAAMAAAAGGAARKPGCSCVPESRAACPPPSVHAMWGCALRGPMLGSQLVGQPPLVNWWSIAADGRCPDVPASVCRRAHRYAGALPRRVGRPRHHQDCQRPQQARAQPMSAGGAAPVSLATGQLSVATATAVRAALRPRAAAVSTAALMPCMFCASWGHGRQAARSN